MSSLIDSSDMDTDFVELLENLAEDDIPEQAFYLALKNALVQLDQQSRLSQP